MDRASLSGEPPFPTPLPLSRSRGSARVQPRSEAVRDVSAVMSPRPPPNYPHPKIGSLLSQLNIPGR